MVRSVRPLAAAALIASALAALPLLARAQTEAFYVPPKIVKQGTASSAIAGSGRVEIKVLVRKDGSLGSASVLKSTNHGDNAAALEIAKSATYEAGTHDGKPGDNFYTYWLTFNGKSVALDVSSEDTLNRNAAGSQMEQINALMGAAKYADAKTELQAYLTTHAGDQRAEVLLGAANFYLNDFSDASDAFSQAGTLPPTFVAVAYNAYTSASDDALKVKNYAKSVDDATHAIALQPSNPVPYFYRGAAETDLMSFGPAIADLEKAKSLEGPATPQATIEIIDVQLVQAYLAGGQPDKGLALAQQVRTQHPDNTQVSAIVVNHYVDDANSQAQAGHTAVAVADLEQAAQLDPSRAAQFYTGAANVMGNAAKTADDSKKALAEVRKALAVAPNDPSANYLAGVLAANAGDQSGAIAYLQKAKANVGDNAKLAGQIDAALKKLGPK